MQTQTEPLEAPLEARTLRSETLIVLALSLGASGVSALISFIGSVTRPGALKNQAATLVGSQAPGRPWLDLAWQVFSIASALVPVALVAHLLARERVGMPAIGFDLTRPRRDLARGAVVAAVIGGTGLAFYLGARAAGFNLTVVPESLPDVWWKIPVLDRLRRAERRARRGHRRRLPAAPARPAPAGRRTRRSPPARCCAAPTTSTRASAGSSATW